MGKRGSPMQEDKVLEAPVPGTVTEPMDTSTGVAVTVTDGEETCEQMERLPGRAAEVTVTEAEETAAASEGPTVPSWASAL